MNTFPAVFDLSDLDGTNGFRIDGESIFTDGESGTSVSGIGDFNNDGFTDVIIGAPGASPNGQALEGASYVIYGNVTSNFGPSLSLSDLDGTNGFRLDGIDNTDSSGISVSGGGDFNNDGIDDLIIASDGDGVPFVSGVDTGEAIVVFGSSNNFGSSIDLENLDGSDGFIVTGFNFNNNNVSSLGDVNNDGIDDFIVGQPFTNTLDSEGNLITNSGISFVVYGDDSGFPSQFSAFDLDGDNGFAIVGTPAGSNTGRSVSAAGDVNGDGIDDFIIGSAFASQNGMTRAGGAHVVFGQQGGFGAILDLGNIDGTNGFQINGTESQGFAGITVSSAGDINGDGIDDIIVGATDVNAEGIDSGASYVVFGSTEGFNPTLELSDLNGENGFRIDGFSSADQLGSSISSAGDVNGDGIDDLLVSAVRARAPGLDSGETYLIFGRDTGFDSVFDTNLINGVNGVRFAGDAGDFSGASVAGIGDFNNDGYDDFIIGAPGANPTNNFSAGASYIVFGGPSSDFVSITGTAVSETLNGTFDNDNINALAGNDSLIGGRGDDILNGGEGADMIDGGDGVDTASYEDSAEGIFVFTSSQSGRNGDAQGDQLTSIENIIGSDFNDQIILNAGTAIDNTVNSGDGDDRIRDRDGGANTFNAGDGEDRVFGGSGDDTIDGGNGEDDLFGAIGNDTINGGEDNARDTLFGSSGNDELNGGGGNDALRGNTGQDTLNGGDGRDNLQGGNQNDILNGDADNDVLDGGAGSDTLNGGTGNDRLTGGGSNDLFIFENGSGIDRITDFNFGSGDQIDLSDFGLADFDAVMALATESGGDVRIQLDADDRLILQDTTLASLDDNDFILV